MGVLLASIGAGEVKGADVYGIEISITDTTTSTTTLFTILSTSPNNISNNPNIISVSPAFSTAATGVSMTGLQATTISTAASTNLAITGVATVVQGSTDSYSVVITTTHDSYTTPTGSFATLSQSESGTYTYTTSSSTQGFQSWYNPQSAPFVTAGTTPGPQSFSVLAAGMGTLSGNANTPGSTTFAGYVQPYTLTNQVTVTFSGNNLGANSPNSSSQFQASTTITAAVPEPASLVMFLTGLPMPLMVLGMLRRRKAQRKADLTA